MKTTTRVRVSTQTQLIVGVIALFAAGGIAASILSSAAQKFFPQSKECGAFGQPQCEPCNESLIVDNNRACSCPDGTVVTGGKCAMPLTIKASSDPKEQINTELKPDDNNIITLGTFRATLPAGADYVKSFLIREGTNEFLPRAITSYGLRVTDGSGRQLYDDVWDPRKNPEMISLSGNPQYPYVFKGLPTETPLNFIVLGKNITKELLPVSGRLLLESMDADGKGKYSLESRVEMQTYSVQMATAPVISIVADPQVSDSSVEIAKGTKMARLGSFTVTTSDEEKLKIKISRLFGGNQYSQYFESLALDSDQKPGSLQYIQYSPKSDTAEVMVYTQPNKLVKYTIVADILADVPDIKNAFSIIEPQVVALQRFVLREASVACGDLDQKVCWKYRSNPPIGMTQYGCKDPLLLTEGICKKECALGQSPDGKACYGKAYIDCGELDQKTCWENGINKPPAGMTYFGCRKSLLSSNGLCKKECALGQTPDGDKCYGTPLVDCGDVDQKACWPNYNRKPPTNMSGYGCKTPLLLLDGVCKKECSANLKSDGEKCYGIALPITVNAMKTGWISDPPQYKVGDMYKQIGVLDVFTSGPAKLESIRIKGSIGDKYGLGKIFSSFLVARSTASPSIVPSQDIVDSYLLTFAEPYSFNEGNPNGGNWGAFYFMGNISKDASHVSGHLTVTDLVFNVNGEHVNYHLPSPIDLHTFTVR